MTVPIIDDPDDLTPSWFDQVLAARGVATTVRSVEVRPLGTGQMAASYRVSVDYASGTGPTALVVKLASPDPGTRTSGALPYRAEIGFYRELSTRLPAGAPGCHLAEISEDASTFTLVLDDVSPAQVGDQIAGCTADQARDAVRVIAGLHAATWCDPSLADLGWLVPPTASLVELVEPYLEMMLDSFVSKRSLDAATVDVLRGFTERYVDWAGAAVTPWSLVHHDFRLDNLLFAAPGTGVPPVTVVDWQTISIAQPARDVAFLLATSLAPVDRRAHERDIVAAYWQQLVDGGVTDYTPEQCWDDYRLGLFLVPYTCLLGDMLAEDHDRGRQMFTVMAERAAAAITDLDAFSVVPTAD